MKFKLSKSQWEKIGKKAGWSPIDENKILDDATKKTMSKKLGQTKESQSQNYNEIKQIIDDGQRAYRLKKSIGDCPLFDSPVHRDAWKEGFRSAMHKLTLNEAFNNFMKQQYPSEDFIEFMDGLDQDNPAKLKPAIRMIIKDKEPSSFGILVPERDFDEKKLDQIVGKHEFNAQPQTIKELARKLWYGISDWKSDETSGYSLFVDGKAMNFSS